MEHHQSEVDLLVRDLKKADITVVWLLVTGIYRSEYKDKGHASRVVIQAVSNSKLRINVFNDPVTEEDKESGFIFTPSGSRVFFSHFKRAVEALHKLYLETDTKPSHYTFVAY
jgi:hypothetical protein